MKLLTGNHLENAIEALKANRLRTALTVVGVLIGVASMSAALSLASGATQFFEKQVAEASDSVAIIRPNTDHNNSDSPVVDPHRLQTSTTLTEKDANDLAKIPNSAATPMATLHTSLKSGDDIVDGKNTTLIGTTTNFLTTTKLELMDEGGQFLTDNSNVSGIVVGNQLSVDLFGTENSIGNVVKIRGETFTVIGVLKPTKQPVNYHGINFDRSAIISLKALKQFTQNVAQIQQIVIMTSEGQPLNPVVKQAEEILEKNHLNEEDYIVLSGDAVARSSGKFFSDMTLFITILTGISLIVGGIGIMNIMLVNVAERNREVGIRKAIGATDSQIVNQFLIESAIIGLIGGVLGYALGLATAFVIGIYLPFTMVIHWQVATLSIGTAVLTGVVFGVYPAIRAAKKDPIESMRS